MYTFPSHYATKESPKRFFIAPYACSELLMIGRALIALTSKQGSDARDVKSIKHFAFRIDV